MISSDLRKNLHLSGEFCVLDNPPRVVLSRFGATLQLAGEDPAIFTALGTSGRFSLLLTSTAVPLGPGHVGHDDGRAPLDAQPQDSGASSGTYPGEPNSPNRNRACTVDDIKFSPASAGGAVNETGST